MVEKRIFCHKFPVLKKKNRQKKTIFWKILPKIATIAYNMKGCLRFSASIFLNIAKIG
jgi:hypothetical protein